MSPPSRSPLTATGQVLGGRYHLNRFVAGGVMGEVWEANDARMDRTVAVKVLRPTHVHDPIALERFRYEARVGAKLDHPGIVKVHDVNAAGAEPPWLVQEFVVGSSLADRIEQDGPMDPARAVHLITQAAEAAHVAHTCGVVHRDLTPRNLMVTPDDVVKVTDFGIARTDSLPSLTMTGQVVGTPAYLSPEQVRGQPANAVSDVYSLAVVLYECLAGVRPFSGSNPIEVARAHLDYQPPPLPAFVPAPLAATVMKSLAKEPVARPGSAAEFARQLRSAIDAGNAPDVQGDAAQVVGSETKQIPIGAASRGEVSVPAKHSAAGPGHPDQLRHPGGDPERYTPRRARTRVAGADGRRAASVMAAVQRGAERTAETARRTWARVQPTARQVWVVVEPEMRDTAHKVWRNRPATSAGLTGLAVLILAVMAVLFLSDTSAGGPR
jgi:hypothetical protein